MKPRFWVSLAIYVSAYFPLVLIFVIKDIDPDIMQLQHPIVSYVLLIIALFSVLIVLFTIRTIRQGDLIVVKKVSNKSGELVNYSIPYMISFFNFNLGDWRAVASLSLFMSILFLLAHKSQNVFINPILAIAGFGLYDITFSDNGRERQGLALSNKELKIGSAYLVQKLSTYLYFVTADNPEE